MAQFIKDVINFLEIFEQVVCVCFFESFEKRQMNLRSQILEILITYVYLEVKMYNGLNVPVLKMGI